MDRGKSLKVTVRLPERLWRDCRILALDERLSAQDVVRRALEEFLKQSRKKGDGR